jgi:hypothetical protein
LTGAASAPTLELFTDIMAASIDDELNQVERDVRTLKIEYEQFFGGGRSRPPSDTQWRVESLLRRYSERTAELSYAQRFRYNGLAQMYAKYVEMWRKKTMQKESGTQQRHFGAAAKAIEAERARLAASRPPAANAPASTPATPSAARGVALAERKVAESYTASFADPERETKKVQQLYQKLIEARTETGEKAGAPNLKDFERFVRQKTKELKSKGSEEVEYTVSVEGGRVKLKARVSR